MVDFSFPSHFTQLLEGEGIGGGVLIFTLIICDVLWPHSGTYYFGGTVSTTIPTGQNTPSPDKIYSFKLHTGKRSL